MILSQISRIILLIVVANLLAAFANLCALADEYSTEQIDFFETRIRPLLANRCIECHGPENSESDLRLDSRDAILKGGSSGKAAAVAGSPDSSLIVHSVRHTGDFDMPPNKSLSEQEIADLARWVAMKMPWPKSGSAILPLSMTELMQQHRSNHWSFQPVQALKAPNVQAHVAFPVDRFVVSNLESIGLSLSPRADRRTLIRRATFDLTGLPPTYEQVTAFVNNDSAGAFARLIDRLLDSPQYGERWARHWLDVVKYADTCGYDRDKLRANAWPYRDYVIRSFNDDKPFKQFVEEQIAGDVLYPDSADGRPRTRQYAANRLARMIGLDHRDVDLSVGRDLARQVLSSAKRHIADGLAQVTDTLSVSTGIAVLSGHGQDLVDVPCNYRTLDLASELGLERSRCAPAFSIAELYCLSLNSSV